MVKAYPSRAIGTLLALLAAVAAGDEVRLISDEPEFADPPCIECEEPAPPPAPPLPQFGGCLNERTKLTGDWGCERVCLAEKGLTFDFDHTYFYSGVVNGGLDQRFAFGGHGDYVINADLGKLGIQEGLFLKLRAEHRFGEAINNATGSFLPANTPLVLPNPEKEDLYLTNFVFTQFLSEQFAVFAGKIDTLDGDANAFAHGRGKTQFSNLNFVANPGVLRVAPYSTLAAGFVVLHELQPVFTLTVLNAVDTAGTSGFDRLFDEGAIVTAEARLPTEFGGLPGHQLFGGSWSSRNYVALGQDPRVILPDVPIARAEGSWALYWNFDQYVTLYSDSPTAGWGVFGRAAITDDDANPVAHFLSAGLGGNSPLACREADTWGAGYFYSASSRQIGPILQGLLGPIGDGQGVEVYYNYAWSPWMHLTADLQVLESARENVDTALVVGLRAKVDF